MSQFTAFLQSGNRIKKNEKKKLKRTLQWVKKLVSVRLKRETWIQRAYCFIFLLMRKIRYKMFPLWVTRCFYCHTVALLLIYYKTAQAGASLLACHLCNTIHWFVLPYVITVVSSHSVHNKSLFFESCKLKFWPDCLIMTQFSSLGFRLHVVLECKSLLQIVCSDGSDALFP